MAEPTGKRPVTTEEMAGLFAASNKARTALQKAERTPGTPPEKLDQLRQRAAETQAAVNNAEGPPPKPTNIFGGPNVGGDLAKQHAQDQADHQARVDARIHAEGQAPVPEPKAAGKIFGMSDQRINRGTDSQGNSWVGTGHAMIRGDTLEKAAAATAKLAKSTTQDVPAAALDKVTAPNLKTDYQPVTFERQVHADGMDLVVGTRPDGTHLTLQKPVYDALHAAAGKDGTIVAGPAEKTAGKRNTAGDDRVFARNAQGETVGVGMPRRANQDQARIWARGAQPETPGKLADVAPGGKVPATTAPQEILHPTSADLFDPEAAHNQAGPVERLAQQAGTSDSLVSDQALIKSPNKSRPPSKHPRWSRNRPRRQGLSWSA